MENERENERMAKAYTETLTILSWVGKKYRDKIPEKFIKFLEENKDKNYVPKINPMTLLENQNILEETANVLALIKLNYWCESEEEKNELISLLKENDNKKQKELQEKFDVYKKFEEKKNKLTKENEKYNHIDENTEEKSLIVKKENIIIRLLKIIQSWFKRG